MFLENLPQSPKVGHRAGEPVQPVDIELLDLIRLDVPEQPLEVGTLGVFPGVASILIDSQVPASHLAAHVQLTGDGQAVFFQQGLTGVRCVKFHCRTPDLCALFGRRFFPDQKYGSTEPFRIKECLPAVLRGGVLRVSVLDVHEHPSSGHPMSGRRRKCLGFGEGNDLGFRCHVKTSFQVVLKRKHRAGCRTYTVSLSY